MQIDRLPGDGGTSSSIAEAPLLLGGSARLLGEPFLVIRLIATNDLAHPGAPARRTMESPFAQQSHIAPCQFSMGALWRDEPPL